jgi:hypothetical protein
VKRYLFTRCWGCLQQAWESWRVRLGEQTQSREAGAARTTAKIHSLEPTQQGLASLPESGRCSFLLCPGSQMWHLTIHRMTSHLRADPQYGWSRCVPASCAGEGRLSLSILSFGFQSRRFLLSPMQTHMGEKVQMLAFKKPNKG